MLKKIMVITVIACVAIVSSTACGKKEAKNADKYADVKIVMNDLAKSFNTFAAKIDAAKTSKDAVAAMELLTTEMKILKAKMQDLQAKYPEIKDQTQPPAELVETVKNLENAMGKMMGVTMKISKFSKDKQVQKAQEAMMKTLSEK